MQDLPLDFLPFFSAEKNADVVSVVLPGLIESLPGPAVQASKNDTWSILGDPVDSEASALLPGARKELEQVRALHPGSRIHTQTSFTRIAVTQVLQTGQPVHIATHLVVGDHTTTSSDDRLAHASLLLSSGDRYGIDDIRRVHPRLPLVVLDACETGSGQFVDAQATYGIARAFLESGTRNLIVTLWPVKDDAAQAFALIFHRALNEGLSPSRAASTARRELRASGTHPADWPAFRLLGRD